MVESFGISIRKANLSLPTLHPQVVGIIYRWRRKALSEAPIQNGFLQKLEIQEMEYGHIEESHYGYGVFQANLYVNSPFKRLADGEEMVHLNFAPCSKGLPFSVMDDLALKMLQHTARNLFEIYLGKETGKRVLEGSILRGDAVLTFFPVAQNETAMVSAALQAAQSSFQKPILLSEDASKFVANKVKFVGTYPVKGFSEPVSVYEPV